MIAAIDRWVRREHGALKGLITGRSVNERFRGLNRSKRNEAKLFLLGLLPIILSVPFLPKWSDASSLVRVWMLLSGAWFVVIVAVGSFFIFRSAIRVSRNHNG